VFVELIAELRQIGQPLAMEVALRCEVNQTNGIDAELAADIVSVELFDLGATAIGTERLQTGQHILIAGFASELIATRAHNSILSTHSALLIDCAIDRTEPDWVRSQRAGLQPIRVGPWHIRAPWDPLPEAIEPVFDIVIDPGRAFGHGAHPSTRLAIELFIRTASTTSHVIDVGTGTGIIAIIAARLGIEVLAVEHDEHALEVARRNIRQNGARPHEAVLDLITVVATDASQLSVEGDDVVVANLTLDVHRVIAHVCSSADRIIVSGILCRQVAQLCELYPDHDAVTVRTHGEWASVDLIGRSGRGCTSPRIEASSSR